MKRFQIIGGRYRGKLNNKERSGFHHLHNSLLVISNLCAYHNRCEPHRVHPPIPQLTPIAMLNPAVREAEVASEEDDSEVDESGQPVAANNAGEGEGEGEGEEEKAPPAKRRRRQSTALAADVDATVDRNSTRVDYGQYEYKWEGDSTGYRGDQFKQKQKVWMWHPVASDWFTAVVTYSRPAGGVNIRVLDTHEHMAVAASTLRPRIA